MISSQPIDGDKLTLVELADISYTEYVNGSEERADEAFEQERQEFLKFARECAASTLSQAAADLDWTYTPYADLPEGVQEATGRTEYLRYQIRHNEEVIKFELVQPCSACGEARITEVTGLVQLGQLLANAKGGAS
jgi:hypothetical protein